jgi:hypothetical protein
MRTVGINSIRTYHSPPEWLLDLAGAHGVAVLLDVPWPKHICYLDSREARAAARQAVKHAAQHARGHRSVLAYSIGNEIPADVVRWHGVRNVERFLAELVDVAKQVDPEGLVTYANFPPTVYLNPVGYDFITFNVYLHDPEVFRRYLLRLQNLVSDRPLVLGELGMDTLRQGEEEQERFLSGHIRETLLTGLAGAFVFSWSDDWHTGGYAIEDWAFGVAGAVAAGFGAWPAALAAAGLLTACFGLWWRGTYRAANVIALLDYLADVIDLTACGRPRRGARRSPTLPQAVREPTWSRPRRVEG